MTSHGGHLMECDQIPQQRHGSICLGCGFPSGIMVPRLGYVFMDRSAVKAIQCGAEKLNVLSLY